MKRFMNHYECPCGNAWQDNWSECCDDKCAACGRAVSPSKSDDLWEAKWVAMARQRYARDGEIEFDDCPAISEGDDAGAYVAAWVWVSNKDAGIDESV